MRMEMDREVDRWISPVVLHRSRVVKEELNQKICNYLSLTPRLTVGVSPEPDPRYK